MRSRHSLVIVLGVITVVAIGSQLTDQGGRDAQFTGSAKVRVAATTTPAPGPTASSGPSTDDVVDEVQLAATAGVTAWQDRDATSRNAALARVATAAYASALQGVDPAVVPQCAIDEVRTDVEADGLARVTITCVTGLVLEVDVTLDDAVWRVSDIVPGA